MLNDLALRSLANLVGVTLTLNGTQEMVFGGKFSIKKYSKIAFAFDRFTNSRAVKKIKKVYEVLCEE